MKPKKITYEFAPDLQKIAEEISRFLFPHVQADNLKCFRSYGSSAKSTIARCHTIGKLMQMTIGTDAHYALEFISEKFDKLSTEDQIKTIIHELMHIPKTFGGGFRHHDFVCDKNVNKHYVSYKRKKHDHKEDIFGLNELKWKNKDNIKKLREIKDEGFF